MYILKEKRPDAIRIVELVETSHSIRLEVGGFVVLSIMKETGGTLLFANGFDYAGLKISALDIAAFYERLEELNGGKEND